MQIYIMNFINITSCILCFHFLLLVWNANGSYLDENDAKDELKKISGKPQHARVGAKKDMGELGTFVITKDFFHPLYRPFNALPYDRRIINTIFHLYTRENPKDYWNLDADKPEDILNSPLNAKHPTRFIVHGFLDSRWYGKWQEILKDNLLLHSENNVIIVDWTGGNSLPYTQATANTRVVGAEIALMINRLQKLKGISPMDCHIIGHSLGAHIAGYAGERLKTLGRISGVDPAKPFFEYMPPSVRLDPTDADFVDVVHTDSLPLLLFGLGMSEPAGHIDFYPNNGKNQPGCKADAIRALFLEGIFDATRRFTACSHQRAVDFYTYSINYRRSPPIGYLCPSWEDFTKGKCATCGPDGSKCAVMGFRADEYKKFKNATHPMKFYLSTSGIAPYWTFKYEIIFKLSKSDGKFKDQNGKVSVTLHGENGDFIVNWQKSATKLVHGATYSLVAESPKFLGSIYGVTVSWKSSSSWISTWFTTKEIHIEYVKLIPLNYTEMQEKKKNTIRFCNKGHTSVTTEKGVMLPLC